MIQAIVEGQGEEAALPVLLRRLLPELGCYVELGDPPIRRKRTEMVREADFKKAIQLAALKPKTRAILVLFDADDDCARTHVPNMQRWSQEAASHLPCAIVMARREYEAWFLAAIESLRGERRLHADAAYPNDPEQVRGAKGVVSRMMPKNTPYSETTDQPALSAQVDLRMTYRRASSFRKLVKELCRILQELGQAPVIPADWKGERV